MKTPPTTEDRTRYVVVLPTSSYSDHARDSPVMITRTRNLRTAIREAELEILEVEEPGDTAIEIGRYTFTGTEDSA